VCNSYAPLETVILSEAKDLLFAAIIRGAIELF